MEKEKRTSKIEISPEEIEKLAEEAHNIWVKEHRRNGWIWGEKLDLEERVHPMLKFYDDLPEEGRERLKLYARGSS